MTHTCFVDAAPFKLSFGYHYYGITVTDRVRNRDDITTSRDTSARDRSAHCLRG